jgi:hypothetical protein
MYLCRCSSGSAPDRPDYCGDIWLHLGFQGSGERKSLRAWFDETNRNLEMWRSRRALRVQEYEDLQVSVNRSVFPHTMSICHCRSLSEIGNHRIAAIHQPSCM